MFEGKLPKHGAFRALEDEHGDGEDLRSISWDELVAQLAAARELRAALRPTPDTSGGSFDAGSARRIAAHSNSKQAVNLDDSSNGKRAAGRVNRAGSGCEPGAPAAPRGNK